MGKWVPLLRALNGLIIGIRKVTSLLHITFGYRAKMEITYISVEVARTNILLL